MGSLALAFVAGDARGQIGSEIIAPSRKTQETRRAIDEVYLVASSWRQDIQLEVYRSMEALQVSLTLDEQMDRMFQATVRGAPHEALLAHEAAASLLSKWRAEIDRVDPANKTYSARLQYEAERRSLKSYEARLLVSQSRSTQDARQDELRGWETTRKAASAQKSGRLFLRLGDAYFGARKWSQAEDAFDKGLASGNLSALDTDRGLFNLGLAQLKLKKPIQAKRTLSKIGTASGLDLLAKILVERIGSGDLLR